MVNMEKKNYEEGLIAMTTKTKSANQKSFFFGIRLGDCLVELHTGFTENEKNTGELLPRLHTQARNTLNMNLVTIGDEALFCNQISAARKVAMTTVPFLLIIFAMNITS